MISKLFHPFATIFAYWLLLFNILSFSFFLLWRGFMLLCRKEKQLAPIYHSLHIIELLVFGGGIFLFVLVYCWYFYQSYRAPFYVTPFFSRYAKTVLGIWTAAEIGLIVRLIIQAQAIPKVSESYDPKEKTLSLAQKIAKELAIQRKIQVRILQRTISPFIKGIVAPTIFISAQDEESTSLNYILMHELVHYKHKDLLFRRIFLALELLSPVLFFLSKEMVQLEEMFCDITVVDRKDIDIQEYQMTLLNIARKATTQMSSDQVAFYIESKAGKQLKERIITMNNHRAEKKLINKVLVSIAIILSCIISTSNVYAADYAVSALAKRSINKETNQVLVEAASKNNAEIYEEETTIPINLADLPRASSSGQIYAAVPPGGHWESGAFMLTQGTTFSINVAIDNPNSSVKLGVISSSGIFYYALGDEHVKSLNLYVPYSTYYTVSIINNSSNTVTVTGFYGPSA